MAHFHLFETVDLEALSRTEGLDKRKPVFYIFQEELEVRINPIDYLMVVGEAEIEEEVEEDITYHEALGHATHTRVSSNQDMLLALANNMPTLTGKKERDEEILREPVNRLMTPAQLAEAVHEGLGFTFVDWNVTDLCLKKLNEYIREVHELQNSVHMSKIPPEEDMAKLRELARRLEPVVDSLKRTNCGSGNVSNLERIFMQYVRPSFGPSVRSGMLSRKDLGVVRKVDMTKLNDVKVDADSDPYSFRY